jgi:hypothetical protein
VDDQFERNDTSAQATNMGALSGSASFSGLTIDLHADGTVDQDWYTWQIPQSGLLTISLTNIQANGGDLWLRIFKSANGALSEIANSTLTGGVSTQQAAVSVNAGDQIFAWVFGFNFALGFYTMNVSLT